MNTEDKIIHCVECNYFSRMTGRCSLYREWRDVNWFCDKAKPMQEYERQSVFTDNLEV